jgi:hypothetical protein
LKVGEETVIHRSNRRFHVRSEERLEEGYREMAKDTEHEREAAE